MHDDVAFRRIEWIYLFSKAVACIVVRRSRYRDTEIELIGVERDRALVTTGSSV